MSDLDLERLGDLWRQQPDPAELERLRRTALAVSRRARLARIVDIATAALVAGVVVLLVLSNPQTETVVSGSAAILLLLAVTVRQRRLREVELRSLTGGTEQMLDQSIERVGATLRHNRLSLIAMGPVLAITFLFASTADIADSPLFAALAASPALRLLWEGFWIAAIAGIALFLVFAIRRGRRELERLQAMRESYRQERESTDS